MASSSACLNARSCSIFTCRAPHVAADTSRADTLAAGKHVQLSNLGKSAGPAPSSPARRPMLQQTHQLQKHQPRTRMRNYQILASLQVLLHLHGGGRGRGGVGTGFSRRGHGTVIVSRTFAQVVSLAQLFWTNTGSAECGNFYNTPAQALCAWLATMHGSNTAGGLCSQDANTVCGVHTDQRGQTTLTRIMVLGRTWARSSKAMGLGLVGLNTWREEPLRAPWGDAKRPIGPGLLTRSSYSMGT